MSWASKNSPPSNFATGFASGYRAAFDTLLPLMQEGVQRSKEAIRAQAATEVLASLETVIQQRLQDARQVALQPVVDLVAKREQFALARTTATDAQEQLKYDHYLTCLDWALNGHHPRSD